MMIDPMNKIIVIQTAFIGDAILTLPLIQKLNRQLPNASIDVVVIPRTAEIFRNHPAISNMIVFDKRGSDKGLLKLSKFGRMLRENKYDLALVPHRSIRSAALTRLIKPKRSIGFDRSAGRWLFTDIVKYDPDAHEIDRNLSLLNPLGLQNIQFELPKLYPDAEDAKRVDEVLIAGTDRSKLVAVAPGTIWNTKRWPADRFALVCKQIASEGYSIALIGSKEDEGLCSHIAEAVQMDKICNTSGKLSLLQSAELIRCCKVLISNDSAPMHLAVAVGTPVIAIFGATVPEFGFAPRGPNDIIIETKGLKCRPCAIHGGDKCPIKTFDCMMRIDPDLVMEKVRLLIS